MTMKVITLLAVPTYYFFKLFWQCRHADISNKENEHFCKQCLLKLHCNIIKLPFWCDYLLTKTFFFFLTNRVV